MSTAPYTATLSPDRSRIVLRGPYSAEWSAWAKQLSGALYVPAQRAWTLPLSDPVAHAVRHGGFAVQCAAEIEAAASRQLRALESAAAFEQPPIRRLDGWRHQVEAYHFAAVRQAAMLAMDMGTGKSKVAVEWLINAECRRTLILCPRSVLGVWRREFARWAPPNWPAPVVLDGNASVAQRLAGALLDHEAARRLRKPFALAVNYEAARMEPLAKWLLDQHWDAVVLDESHRAKGHNTAVGKLVWKLGRRATRRLCLTGTPMPHSPLDVFSQYRFLDPSIFGESFHRFRGVYADMNPIFPSQVVRWKNQDEFRERFAALAYRVGADVLDLPEATHSEIRVRLDAKTALLYGRLEKDMIAEVERGVVTAANGLVKLLRLQQLTSGYTQLDETREAVEVGQEKADALADWLIDVPPGEPVVVFCRFRHDLDLMQRLAGATDRRYGELSGRRNDLTAHAEMPGNVDLFGVQIQSGGVGIDLTRARYAVYFSVGFSLGDYLQSLARLVRPGQTRPVHFRHVIASGTVDEAVYGAIRQKQEIVEYVLSSLKRGGLAA